MKFCDSVISGKHKMIKLWRRERMWERNLKTGSWGARNWFFLIFVLSSYQTLCAFPWHVELSIFQPRLSPSQPQHSVFYSRLYQGTCHELPLPLFMFQHLKKKKKTSHVPCVLRFPVSFESNLHNFISHCYVYHKYIF